jgi:hypothetical protein
MPTMEEKATLLEYLDRCEPEAWKILIRYMARDLVAEQSLFAELICREAERRAKKASAGNAQHFPADHIAAVLADVGLRIVLTGSIAAN